MCVVRSQQRKEVERFVPVRRTQRSACGRRAKSRRFLAGYIKEEMCSVVKPWRPSVTVLLSVISASDRNV